MKQSRPEKNRVHAKEQYDKECLVWQGISAEHHLIIDCSGGKINSPVVGLERKQREGSGQTHLDSSFCQVCLECNLFPCVDVRIMGFLEGSLQFFELSTREGSSDSSLFPLLGQESLV